MNCKITLKTINELLSYSFFIPSYQRGYRWREKQITDLLDDILDFSESNELNSNNFYCLQPIIVKLKDKESNMWEVIDGQQRLTTIYLILKNIETITEGKKIKKISYETRPEVEKYLESLDERQKDDYIDFHFIYNADKTIKNWFKETSIKKNKGALKAHFSPYFLDKTKVIWYEINDEQDSYDIFTRINIGKIPLTNAELIKALFLKRWNNSELFDTFRIKQLQIANEWDKIENTLQENSFWYFIYNNNNNKQKYINRIEYIFDLMKNKRDDDEDKFTFYKFYEEFKNSKENNEIPDTNRIWFEIKKYFLTFEEWYKDKEFYHLIGYLISIGYPIQEILKLNQNKTKTEFKNELRDKIKEKFKDVDIDELTYEDKENCKRILLLFNIETLLNNKETNLRFPFDIYKTQNWDIEHIRPQTEYQVKNINEASQWAENILEYYSGETTQESHQKYINSITESSNILKSKDNPREVFQKLYQLAYSPKKNDTDIFNIFNNLFNLFRNELNEEDQVENKNHISNLTLLNSSINRSYKNAFFPIKRKIILEEDRVGNFIPICTKNVFTKSYSKKLDDMMHWKKEDAEAYLNALKNTLNKYLNNNTSTFNE